MNDFIREFDTVKDTVGNFVENIRSDRKPIICFGAGHCSRMLYDLLIGEDIEVLAFCDNDEQKQGHYLYKKPIMSLIEAMDRFGEFNIVITVSSYEDVCASIQSNEFKGKIYWLEAPATYHKSCLFSKGYIKKNCERFANVYHLLHDDISRLVYINSLSHTLSLDKKYMDCIDQYEIQGYFGTNLLRNKNLNVFLDAGAYNGDTIREFISFCDYQFDKIYAFEPDGDNFLNLHTFAKELGDSKVNLYKAGVGRHSEQLHFVSHGVISRVDELGNQIVQIQAIDDIIETQVDIIKMDIEGAEADALYGAQEIIKKYNPVLMISAYHKKEDMFALIEQIKEYLPNSKVYMRHTFFYQSNRHQPDFIFYVLT